MMIIGLIALISILYISIIISFTIGLKRLFQKKEKKADKLEKLSLVIAFRNEEKNLTSLLEALHNQTLSTDLFEIILVNDHSIDNSIAIALEYSTKLQNIRVIELSNEATGKKAALSIGVIEAKNPFIVFTDADCKPSERWLETISQFAGNGSDFIIGVVLMMPDTSFQTKMQSLEYSSLMATAAGSRGVNHPIIASSANLAFRKTVFENIYNQLNPMVSSGDDMFLLHQAKRIKGCEISFLNDADAIVRTSPVSSISGALNQRKRWASKSIYYKDFDTIFVGFTVLLFNLTLLISLIWGIFNFRSLLLYAILLIIKYSVDYILVSNYLKFFRQEKLLRIFLPLQLLYPIYIVISFFAGISIKGHWKGRRIS